MKLFGTFGALFCFLAVLAGAVGSHALRDHLAGMGGQSNFDLATRYMFYHGLALILVGLVRDYYPGSTFYIAGWLFVAGTVLFQGNLYLISLSHFRSLSFLTPIGGTLLLIGWLTFVYSAVRARMG
jgi:uncharacterized membrane protein YgdD (TMEM256/DUF423 family)